MLAEVWIRVREKAVNQVNDARNAALCGSFDLTAKIFVVGKKMKRGFFHDGYVCVHKNAWMKIEKYQIQTEGTTSN